MMFNNRHYSAGASGDEFKGIVHCNEGPLYRQYYYVVHMIPRTRPWQGQRP